VAELAIRRAVLDAFAVCERASLSWRLATVDWPSRTARLRRLTEVVAFATLVWTDATDVLETAVEDLAEAVAGSATTAARDAATATERRN
jgi:hypothetical protein